MKKCCPLLFLSLLLIQSLTAQPPDIQSISKFTQQNTESIINEYTQFLTIYAHYDGQPVNAAQWDKALEPFTPKLFSDAIAKNGTAIPFPADGSYNNNWRIYARSASDDKAGIQPH